MNDVEWRTRTDPEPMLNYPRGRASERKLRLYAVARCRSVGHMLRADASWAAVAAAERYADGALAEEELRRAYFAASPDAIPGLEWAAHTAAVVAQYTAWTGDGAAWYAAERTGFLCHRYLDDPATDRRVFAAAARCVFGDPFRPAVVDRAWLTADVVALATGVYEDRAFDRLPILADALQDAGCEDADILEHCRQPGPHARGCWVADALTGRG